MITRDLSYNMEFGKKIWKNRASARNQALEGMHLRTGYRVEAPLRSALSAFGKWSRYGARVVFVAHPAPILHRISRRRPYGAASTRVRGSAAVRERGLSVWQAGC